MKVDNSDDEMTGTDSLGRTKLHLAYLGDRRDAASRISFSLIVTLRAAGADPLARDIDGRTPLMLAVRQPVFVKDAWRLLHRAHFREFLATDNDGKDVYDLAKEGGLEISDETWASLVPSPWVKFNLSVLAVYCELETLKRAILNGRGPSDIDSRGETPIFSALRNADERVFSYLLSLGVDLEHPDSEGRTVLYRTVDGTSYRPRETRLLISAGAKVAVRDNHGLTPFHLAVRANDLVLITDLLEHGGLADQEDATGETPFEVACRFNTSPKVIEAMLQSIQSPTRQSELLQRSLKLSIQACVERTVLETLVHLGATLDNRMIDYARQWKYWRDMELER